MDNKLTKKQELFVQGLLSDLSQREAYKQAYNAENMKNETIDRKAHELLQNGKVSARYEQLRGKVIKKIEDQGLVTAEKIIKEIASIAFDDISNYLDYKTVLTQIGEDFEGNPIVGYDTVLNLKDSSTVNTKNISEISKGRDGQFKFKMYCRDAALYKLADIFGLKEIYSENNDKDKDIEIKIIRKGE